MLPKAPKCRSGPEGIEQYRIEVRNVAATLRNRTEREFFRKDLETRAKYYKTLCARRANGNDEAKHFAELAALHRDELDLFGPEPPPKRRRKNPADPVPLKYPQFPNHLSHRVHFLESGSLRREKSAVLANYADAMSRQAAPNGDVLLSVAVSGSRTQFFERLIEATGSEGLGPKVSKSGSFSGYIGADGALVTEPGWQDPRSPWRRIRDDNFNARLYHWSLRRGQLDPTIELPEIWPPIPESLPWDPDERYQEILAHTDANRLDIALSLVDSLPKSDRELLFDEVMYLKFLLGETLRGDDVRYLARKYIAGSAIRTRLEEEFDAYIAILDYELSEAGPIPDVYPFGTGGYNAYADDPDTLKRSTPPLKDWPATRTHYFRQFEAYGHPVRPRGRIFVWNPDLASGSLDLLLRWLRPEMVLAEDAFRRERSIPEIGRGWASEAALFDLISSLYPDAIHQWRPAFLGLQSVDVYLPSLGLAIEYQGEQHYHAVAVFGGEEGFAATKARDERKRAILQANGFKLLEWHYSRPITLDEVKAAIDS